jgi:hypothetical protein
MRLRRSRSWDEMEPCSADVPAGGLGEGAADVTRWRASMRSTRRATVCPWAAAGDGGVTDGGSSANGIRSVEVPGSAGGSATGALVALVGRDAVDGSAPEEGAGVASVDPWARIAGKVIRLDSGEDFSRGDGAVGGAAGRRRSRTAMPSATPSTMRPAARKKSSMNGVRRRVGALGHWRPTAAKMSNAAPRNIIPARPVVWRASGPLIRGSRAVRGSETPSKGLCLYWKVADAASPRRNSCTGAAGSLTRVRPAALSAPGNLRGLRIGPPADAHAANPTAIPCRRDTGGDLARRGLVPRPVLGHLPGHSGILPAQWRIGASGLSAESPVDRVLPYHQTVVDRNRNGVLGRSDAPVDDLRVLRPRLGTAHSSDPGPLNFRT